MTYNDLVTFTARQLFDTATHFACRKQARSFHPPKPKHKKIAGGCRQGVLVQNQSLFSEIYTSIVNALGMIVPTHHFAPISDDVAVPCDGHRRSSLPSTTSSHNNNTNHNTTSMVLPLMTSNSTRSDCSGIHKHCNKNSTSTGSVHAQGMSYKIDPVAISLAAKAKRQQQQNEHTQHQHASPSQQQQQQETLSTHHQAQPVYTNRRGSLDVHVEYAVAMVNIMDPKYDMDDRDMCPFGTRRDSVCGGSNNCRSSNTHHSNTTSNDTNKNGSYQSPTRERKRILKKEILEEQARKNMDDGDTMNNDIKDDTAACITTTVVVELPTLHPLDGRRCCNEDTATATAVVVSDNNTTDDNDGNERRNRPLTLIERIFFR